jgi:hypothetical protein
MTSRTDKMPAGMKTKYPGKATRNYWAVWIAETHKTYLLICNALKITVTVAHKIKFSYLLASRCSVTNLIRSTLHT